MLTVEKTPFIDSVPVKGKTFYSIKRGVVFNLEQARCAFQNEYSPTTVLCVDGPICKWVYHYAAALNFFEPTTRYECKDCEVVMIGLTGDDFHLCKKCNQTMFPTDISKLKKRLAKIVAGDL